MGWLRKMIIITISDLIPTTVFFPSGGGTGNTALGSGAAWVNVYQDNGCVVDNSGQQTFTTDCSSGTWTSFQITADEPVNTDNVMTSDDGDADNDDNPDGNFNNIVYPDYDQSQSWPTIPNVLNGVAFVKFYLGANCPSLAKQQILPNTISNYGALGQTINAYTEAGGANIPNVKKAISYINSELSNGRPVIVGVDVYPGQAKPPITDILQITLLL
jgi:hypothetical protein